MALEAPPAALDHLMLGDGGEETGGGPAFLIGLFGERRPNRLDGRKAQFGQ